MRISLRLTNHSGDQRDDCAGLSARRATRTYAVINGSVGRRSA
jgi:hypothetical protein